MSLILDQDNIGCSGIGVEDDEQKGPRISDRRPKELKSTCEGRRKTEFRKRDGKEIQQNICMT